MNGMIRKIARKFEQEEINYELKTFERMEVIRFENRVANTSARIMYTIYSDENQADFDQQHIHVISSEICHISSPTLSLYKCLNELNIKYHYVKFYMDNDNDIIAKTDDIVPFDSSEEAIWELLIRMVGVLDDAYPQLMKAAWG